jgi:DNA-binding MarR family transcriptional regulator
MVHLTGEGQKLIRRIFSSHAALIADETSVLSAADHGLRSLNTKY